MSILEIRGLVKHYNAQATWLSRKTSKPIKALDGVSLKIAPGEALGLVGESGSGKSTLAHCVLCLEKPTKGNIFFNSQDLTRLSQSQLRPFRRLLQPVFQDPYASLNPLMRVGDIVAEPLLIHKLGNPEQRRHRVADVLQEVGLDDTVADRYPHAFSGGQRQRIAIARALSVQPRILVADEPLSALDVSVQGQILKLLQTLKENLGLTLLFVSHSLPVVRQLCDRVAVMFRGRIVELAATRQFFASPLHPYSQTLLASTPLAQGPEPPPWNRHQPIGELTEAAPGHWVAD